MTPDATQSTGKPWTLERVNEMRRLGVEESLSLDYKRAAALDRANPKTSIELTKDVSSFANSSGGVLIYGVGEEPTKKHLPGELDPIKRADVSKEWLEAIILTIQPHIDGIQIHPIPADPEHVLYVVEVPQSSTAHQARDHKYYKRWNFAACPMEDYEIRDVMNRAKHPRIHLSFQIARYIPQPDFNLPPLIIKNDPQQEAALRVFAHNQGFVLARYVFGKIGVPIAMVEAEEVVRRGYRDPRALPLELLFETDNKKQDRNRMGVALSDVRFEPILPGLTLRLSSFGLRPTGLVAENQDLRLTWRVHADNAPPMTGTCRLGDIPVEDSRPA